MALRLLLGLVSGAMAAVSGTSIYLKSSSTTKSTWNDDSNQISKKQESLARHRFGVWASGRSDGITDKYLLRWDDKDKWIKKVKENVTNKDVWPASLLFLANRSDEHLANLLRKSCYSATVLWDRQTHSDSSVLEEAKKDFRNISGDFKNKTYSQLCASNSDDGVSETIKVKQTRWTQLGNYLKDNQSSKYKISNELEESKLTKEAKIFVKQQKDEVPSYNTKSAMEKIAIGVTEFSDGTTLFESKYTGNQLFDDLNNIPVLKNVLTAK